MGQKVSSERDACNSNGTTRTDNTNTNTRSEKSKHISHLIDYARTSYQENPTEALAAIIQAVTLNSGKESADMAMDRLRDELGDDIAEHIGSYQQRLERATEIVGELLDDQNTFLYQQGKHDILRQTMEDGSSVVCTRCNDVVSTSRWQQHQQYWCLAIKDTDADTYASIDDDSS
jgi:hypothetical protein